MKRKLAMLMILSTLAACNTVSGVGQDISTSANHVAGWFSY